MIYLFYIVGAVAVISTLFVIVQTKVVHALLYLIVSLLSVAVIFFILGAPFVAALEVIIYAGAIMVLFIFIIMMLNLGPQTAARERTLLQPSVWTGPALLSAVLFCVFLRIVLHFPAGGRAFSMVGPKEVAMSLFGPYLIGVELSSVLLMAGLVGAFHLGRGRGGKDDDARPENESKE